MSPIDKILAEFALLEVFVLAHPEGDLPAVVDLVRGTVVQCLRDLGHVVDEDAHQVSEAAR